MRPSVLGVCFCELLCHVNVYLVFFFVLGVKRLTFNSVFFNSLETKSGAVNPGERPSPFTFTQCLKSTICTLVKEDLREFPNPETPALKLVIIIFETPFPLPWESISQSFFVFSASRWNIGKSCCCTYYIWSLCLGIFRFTRSLCLTLIEQNEIKDIDQSSKMEEGVGIGVTKDVTSKFWKQILKAIAIDFTVMYMLQVNFDFTLLTLV